MDRALTIRIEQLHEQDDTMGHRKLAVMLATGKNWVQRVMHTYGNVLEGRVEIKREREAPADGDEPCQRSPF